MSGTSDLVGAGILMATPLGPAAAIAGQIGSLVKGLGFGHNEPIVTFDVDPFSPRGLLWGVRRRPSETRFKATLADGTVVGGPYAFGGKLTWIPIDAKAVKGAPLSRPADAATRNPDGTYTGDLWAVLALEASRRGSPYHLVGSAVIVQTDPTRSYNVYRRRPDILATLSLSRIEIASVEFAATPWGNEAWQSKALPLIEDWNRRQERVKAPRFDYVDVRGWSKGAEDTWHEQVPLGPDGPQTTLSRWKGLKTARARKARKDWKARRLLHRDARDAAREAWERWTWELDTADLRQAAFSQLSAAFADAWAGLRPGAGQLEPAGSRGLRSTLRADIEAPRLTDGGDLEEPADGIEAPVAVAAGAGLVVLLALI